MGGVAQPLAGASPDVSSLPPSTAQAPPAPAQAQPPADTRSTAAKVIDAIGGILGGRTRTTYQVDENGKTAPVQTPNSGGQQARNILGGALRGLAAGAQVHGPGAGLRSLAAGAGEEQQHAQQQDQQRRQQASTDFEQSQQALARKGSIALQNQQIAESAWRMVREQGEIDTKTADRLNEMNSLVASDSRNKDYGHYESFKDFADKHKDLGVNIPQLQAQGALRAIPTFEGGKPTGVQIYELHPAWADQKNDEPVKISVPGGLDAKGKPSFKDYTIPAQGMNNGDILRAQIGLGQQAMKGSLDATEAKKNVAQAGEAGAAAQKDVAEAKALGSGEGSPIEEQAKSLVEGNMDPSQLSKRSTSYGATLAAANNYSMKTTGKPFDIAKAQSDYKFSTTPQTQNTLKLIQGLSEPGGAIDIAKQAATKLPAINEQTANKVFNATATELGSTEATNFHTAMLGLADEYSKVMGGGTSSDIGRQQALDILKHNYAKGQLAGAIGVMQQDIAARKSAIVGDNRYLTKQYGRTFGPPPGALGKAPGSDGKMHYHDVQGKDLGPAE